MCHVSKICYTFATETKKTNPLNKAIMTHEEFTQRTGWNVTLDEYAKFDAMYLKAGNMDKDTFCKDLKKHYGSLLIDEFYKQACDNEVKLNVARYEVSKMADMMIEKGHELGDQEMISMAIEAIGKKRYITRCIELGVQLCDDDYAIVLEFLK